MQLLLDERSSSNIATSFLEHTIALHAFAVTRTDEDKWPLSHALNESLHRSDSEVLSTPTKKLVGGG